MLPKTLKYGAVLACGVLVLASPPSSADDGKGDKPALSGVWVQNGEEMKIEFAGKDKVKFVPHGGNDCIIVCQYTVDKKGLVKAKVIELEGNAKEELGKIVPVGLDVPHLAWVWMVSLNAFVGVVCAVWYLRIGIGGAILVHFGTDLVWHVLSRLF